MFSNARLGLRQLVKSPGFTLTALVTLALGIGLNATAFTVLNRLLLQSLPFRDTSSLVRVWGTSAQSKELSQSPGDYFDERDQSTVFQALAAYYVSPTSSLAEPGKVAAQSTVLGCTANFFSVMGITPVLGRTFTPQEEAHHDDVVVLGYAFWKKHFNGDPSVLGRTLRLNGTVVTIVGVAPSILDDPLLFGGGAIELIHLDATDVNRGYREGTWYNVAGRLKPGATLVQAQTEMTAIATRLAHDFPKTNAGRGFRVAPFPTDNQGDIGRHIIWLIMDLAAAVLLIACFNLANLQLVRATARSREIAIRLALGSPRMRIIGMLLTESVILSLAGGALGLLVAKWGNDYISSYLNFPMSMDYRVLVFAFAASAVTGAVFGTVPAWLATRSDLNTALKQGSRGTTGERSRHRLRQVLIVAQLAVALILLTGAGYFIRGLYRITHHELGWKPDHLLMGMYELPNARYGEHGDKRSLAFGEKFRASLLQLPGVEQATITLGSPIYGIYAGEPFYIEGRTPPQKGTEPHAYSDRIMPGYFATYGMHILEGRDFTDADRPGSRNVAIISQSLAEKFWPGENAIGKRIGGPDPSKPEWSEVVGVVNDVRGSITLAQYETPYQIYRPWLQSSFRWMVISLRTNPDPRTVIDGVRHAMANLEPDIAIPMLAAADDTMTSQLSGLNLTRRLLGEMALLGLLLSALGIYGVIANLASERTQEVGVRMALGAQASDVQWLFMRNGIRLALIGTGIGLLCSFGLIEFLDRAVLVVPGHANLDVIGVALFLAGVALVACWLPAWRATKVNPNVALRME